MLCCGLGAIGACSLSGSGKLPVAGYLRGERKFVCLFLNQGQRVEVRPVDGFLAEGNAGAVGGRHGLTEHDAGQLQPQTYGVGVVEGPSQVGYCGGFSVGGEEVGELTAVFF